jgi:uncharacterized protein YjbJ (UPF0337 family)
MKTYDQTVKPSTTDRVQGSAKIFSGKIKEDAGKVFRSPNLQAKGNAEKNEGHVQKKIGEIEKVLGA